MNQPISIAYNHNSRQLFFDFCIFGTRIKKGFIWNGASFPKFLYRWLRPFSPEFSAFSCFHDAGYCNKLIIRYRSRKRIDKIGILILKKNEVEPFKRKLIYSGIRVFGWIYYK